MMDAVATRIIVVPIVKDEGGRILLCKMPPDRGVFPGRWGLPGGGVEPGERIHDALKREVFEELGVAIGDIRPLFFKDGVHEKTFPDGARRSIYMIFLLFECHIAPEQTIYLNEEFSEYAWVDSAMLGSYDLNAATRDTFASLGLL